jgi:hypothetical protein
MKVYLAAVGHFALDMLLGHVVDQPVLMHEALVADPKKRKRKIVDKLKIFPALETLMDGTPRNLDLRASVQDQ